MLVHTLKNKSKNIIEGPLILEPMIYQDQRGYFYENWNIKVFKEKVDKDVNFVQENTSYSKKDVLRGLHYQLPPYPQGKLIRVSSGAIFDVIVDLRVNSKTFSSWASIKLDDINKKQLWIPSGFAHGFLALSDRTTVHYKVTNFWSKAHERSILWSDKSIDIDWPKIQKLIISQKDLIAPSLKEQNYKKELFY